MSRPRVLFVGPTRYTLPLAPGLERKWAAIEQQLEVRVVARLATSCHKADARFELVGGSFYGALPVRVRRAVRDFRPRVIVAEDPRTATLVIAARPGVPVIAEVHGNWRHSTRLYGSPARRALSPLVDRLDEYGVRHADAVRALSGYTAGLVEASRGRPPDAVFPTYSDLSAFTSSPVEPLPERPAALFVGVLEPYKNVDGLTEAWRLASPQVPQATLTIVGKGSRPEAVDRLVADGLATHVPELSPEDVARKLDESTVLVLPSRYEGLGRVVIEAFARGRGVVATPRRRDSRSGRRTAGEGLLVDPEDTQGLADALVRVLSDDALAERLGAAAHERFPEWNQTPEQFAERLRALVGHRPRLSRMRADELKQALKNGVYRSIGEAATGAGVVDGIAERTLCVLMYHKVNDTDGNTVTVPTSQFDEQMAQLGELDYTVVSLDDVLAHYLERPSAPDPGRADHVRRRLPRQPRERRPDPAAARLSRGALRADRLPRRPSAAAARRAPRRARDRQPDARLEPSSPSSSARESASSRTGSATGRSPTSRWTRPRARSRSRSSVSRRRSAARCGRSRT